MVKIKFRILQTKWNSLDWMRILFYNPTTEILGQNWYTQTSSEEKKNLLWRQDPFRNGDHCTNSTPYNLIGKHKNADWQHFPSQTVGDSGINFQRCSNSHASPSHWMQTFPFSLFWENSFLPSFLLPHLFYLKAVFGSLVFSWHFKKGSKQLIWQTVKLTWYQS